MEMGREGVSVTGEQKHTSSWVVDLEKMLADDNPDSGSMEEVRWEAQSIYLVPEWLKGTNSKAYQPQLVSLGPFHHGDPNLLPMQEHKCRALVHLIKRSERPLQDFISAIDDVAEELQAAYGKDLHVKWRNDRRSFVDMMLTDGCFLLEIIRHPFSDYERHDPVFSRNGRFQIGSIIRSDMLLIENQLPLLVLKKILGLLPPDYLLLQEDETDTDETPVLKGVSLAQEDRKILEVSESLHEAGMDGKIHLMVLHFLERLDEGRDLENKSLRHHPLKLYHGSLTHKKNALQVSKKSQKCKYESMPTALEIHQAGIEIRKIERGNLRDIVFKGGVLTMPEIEVNDDTKCLYLNLMAFERLHFDVCDLVTAYVVFMDDMIDSAKDVAMLRSNKVLINMLGCDKEAAKLFNGTLNRGQLLGLCHALHDEQSKVNEYCKQSWHKWRATLIHTHFKNPWAFISLAAAVILLIATLLQTIYTMKQNKS